MERMSYSIKPSVNELKDARNIVESTLERIRHVLPKQESFNVELGWASGQERGRAFGDDTVYIYFNTDEGWRERLETVVAEAYAESWFNEHKDTDFVWEELLRRSLGMAFAEENTKTSQSINVSDEDWRKVKKSLGEEVEIMELDPALFDRVCLEFGRRLLSEERFDMFKDIERTEVVARGDMYFL